MTYTYLDAEDGKEKRPSCLIEELFRSVPVIRHPVLPFDASYFQQDGFRSCSTAYYQVAQSYYGKKPQSKRPLVQIPAVLERKPQEKVDLRHLRKLARHPIQFFFERKHGIYFEREKRQGKEFVLSALDLAYFRRTSLKGSLGDALKKADEKGLLPTGRFRDVALHRIEEDVTEYQESLAALGVDPRALFSIEFKASCPALIEVRTGEWVAPPLEVPLPEGRSISLIGCLENLSPQGMLFHGEDRLEDWVKAWPLFLAALQGPVKIAPHLLLTKKGVCKENFFQNPLEALGRYLVYYETAMENLSICMPRWAKSILKEGIVEPDNENTDPCLTWMLQRDKLEWAGTWGQRWQPLLREVFHEVI